MEPDRSPKRRRILSSFNPPEPLDDARSSDMSAEPAPRRNESLREVPAPSDHETAAPRPTKLRFKSKSSKSSRTRDGRERVGDHHHHPFQDPPLSPNTAFRESLFDALADDEGAAYWESVYGQPIHIYGHPDGGPLERMTDDEYAAYVRQKMWERTHAGLLEARAARRAQEQAQEEERRRQHEEAERIAREMERSLRRGMERRRRKVWRRRWEAYLARWRAWEEAGHQGGVEAIPWPWAGDDDEEDDAEEVRAFFVQGIGLEEVGEKEFAARLKEERVRWHPDKMQQRLGGKVDDRVMRDVTAVFQAVDALWNDTRKNGG
ncbi:uncharacterized protein THITE_2055001 [Thermothielavioides terrestris NRRL 8126]|uniref:J domain-containing protein n=1 Tax=Thermothielavioides terrestris (strain ATCC 38088 / NRRL 8126) TaxID=578455 RepID=G2RBU4_THETT|nr:uncharacterized protein THITE_2055001 [Thermothielavioides terrestris NRRL 8126]AEO69265.1 hypothetical protein THITE_2055001 [Thermothielavioides terrestris NRRL 8126]